MLSQFIAAIINNITNQLIPVFKGWKHIKFYFISLLIFLFSISFVYRDVITLTMESIVFNQIRFRECRDVYGLDNHMKQLASKDTSILSYTIYLYEPVNNSLYKKVIVTNNINVMHSPSLQGMYLKDQPTVNKELLEHDYYMPSIKEIASHQDMEYWLSFGDQPRLVYGLKLNNKVIGEVWLKFKEQPSPIELEKSLKDISALLYNYII